MEEQERKQLWAEWALWRLTWECADSPLVRAGAAARAYNIMLKLHQSYPAYKTEHLANIWRKRIYEYV